jgi:hypothetical protein
VEPPPDPGYRHRLHAEIVTHAVWLLHAFNLGPHDVELQNVELEIPQLGLAGNQACLARTESGRVPNKVRRRNKPDGSSIEVGPTPAAPLFRKRMRLIHDYGLNVPWAKRWVPLDEAARRAAGFTGSRSLGAAAGAR